MASGPSAENYPPGPAVSLEHAGEPTKTTVVGAHLAANLMPLCGVPNPSMGDGVTRTLSLSEINIATVRQGAPSSIKEDKLVKSAHVIHNASLQRFGPLTIAATVLTGANYVFEPLAEAHDSALEQSLFDGLSQRIRVGMTACWAFQTFSEQPQLFMTGGQAWRVQRTLIHDNLVPAAKSAPNKFAPSHPDTFAPLRKLTEWGEDIGDVFFDSCRDLVQTKGALVMTTDAESGQTIPKVKAHPGDFTERFLRTIGMWPSPRERLLTPLMPEGTDRAILSAAWAANDLTSRIPPENELAPACRAANEEILSRLSLLPPTALGIAHDLR